MIISLIYLIFSFILDNFMSNIFYSTLADKCFFVTIYIIIAFVVIYPYFISDKKYFILLLIFGILFDILYTGTFIFNTIIFLVFGILIKFLNNVFPENLLTTNIIGIITISTYHIISFIILTLISDIDYEFMTLINIIITSIIMTVIYTTISYFCMKYIYNKFNIKQIK